MPRLLSRLRTLWLNFAILITMIAVVELLAFTYYSARGALNRLAPGVPQEADQVPPDDAYPDRSWLEDYFAEADDPRLRYQWESYTNWRHQPYQGTLITIDQAGNRTTWNESTGDGKSGDVIHVGLFGGSTLWGVGNRNDFTIASQLSRSLARQYPGRFHVTNYGEIAYVTTQSAITLLREVHAGRVPDIAIFYEGFNDVYSAFQSGVAGLPENEADPARDFNILNASRPWALYREALTRTNTYSLAAGIRRALLRQPLPQPVSPVKDAPAPLMREIVDVYAKNMALVETMGRTWGFASRFYWQPTVYTKAMKTPGEQRNETKSEDFHVFYRRALETRDASDLRSTHPDFRDLSGMFDGFAATAFLDQVHTTEAANERIANQMAVDLAAIFVERAAVRAR